jgi:cobalt-precorrin 5A hydrolase
VDVLVTDEAESESQRGAKTIASIRLCPGRYAAGIGCRKGKSFDEIRELAERVLADNGVDAAEVGAVATIDIKAEEPGIKALAEYWKVPLITYEASLLGKVQGDFASSEFVKQTVGVDSVAERSAVLAAGSGSKLIVRKQAENGMTIAVAEKR